MKKSILSVVAILGGMALNAQVIDTVIVGSGYANTVFYSLENDNQAVVSATAWDIAFATSLDPSNDLTTSILFNYKTGSLYEIPGSDPADFDNADTTGLSTWNPLFNSDTSWAKGAFNNTEFLGGYDYGWGNYDAVTHMGIAANRVFIIKYPNNTYKKLKIDLSFSSGYTLTVANLDNTLPLTLTVPVTPYSAKNFVYASIASGTVLDLEPESTEWDLKFHQYPYLALGGYPVAGIFHNHGTVTAEAHHVNATTYTDYGSQIFQSDISTIGYDWKNAQAGTVEDSLVYFVKTQDETVWKLVMTGFISGASGNGSYIFSKQNLTALALKENQQLVFDVYPNPATDQVTIALDNNSETTVTVIDMTGRAVYSESVQQNGLSLVQLNVSGFNAGMYTVVCASAGNAAIKKLVIK